MKQIERDNILTGLKQGQADMQSDIEIVKRGLYGDKDNDTPGLIKRQGLDDKKFEAFMTQMKSMNTEIKTNSRFVKKVKNITKMSGAGGATATVAAIAVFFKQIKELLTSLFN